MRRSVLVTLLIVAATGLMLWSLLFPSSGPATAAQESGPLLVLYSEPNFGGISLEVRDSLVDLPVIESSDGAKFDWNDSIRSLRVVSGTWRLYQHGRCNTELDQTPLELLDLASRQPARGWSSLMSATSRGALEAASLETGALADDISSIELVSKSNLPDWAAP
jgi:hypothetical protein